MTSRGYSQTSTASGSEKLLRKRNHAPVVWPARAARPIYYTRVATMRFKGFVSYFCVNDILYYYPRGFFYIHIRVYVFIYLFFFYSPSSDNRFKRSVRVQYNCFRSNMILCYYTVTVFTGAHYFFILILILI